MKFRGMEFHGITYVDSIPLLLKNLKFVICFYFSHSDRLETSKFFPNPPNSRKNPRKTTHSQSKISI
jgi:hypothetical protein